MDESKSPSRKRYEEQNPVVSFRISKDAKEEFDALVDDLDLTKKEWFEQTIEDDSKTFKSVFEQGKTKGRNQGYDEGFDEGYEEGRKDTYDEIAVTVPCNECGEPVVIDTDDRHRALWDWVEQMNGEWSALPPAGVMECPIQHETCPDDE